MKTLSELELLAKELHRAIEDVPEIRELPNKLNLASLNSDEIISVGRKLQDIGEKYKEKAIEARDYLYKNKKFDTVKNIKIAAEKHVELVKSYERQDLIERQTNQIKEEYTQKTAKELGYENAEKAEKGIARKRISLQDKFLGNIRFRKEINEYYDTESMLRGWSTDSQDITFWSNHNEWNYIDIYTQILKKTSKEITKGYREHVNEMLEEQPTLEFKTKKDEEIIDQYFQNRFEKVLEDLKIKWSDEGLDELESYDLDENQIRKASQLIKTFHTSQMDYDKFKSELANLPYLIRETAETLQYGGRDMTQSYEQLNKLVSEAPLIERDVQQRKMRGSFNKATGSLRKIIEESENSTWMINNQYKKVDQDLNTAIPTLRELGKINPMLWDAFVNNENVQEVFSDVSEAKKVMEEVYWSKIALDQTDDNLYLAEDMRETSNPGPTPYLIMDFWTASHNFLMQEDEKFRQLLQKKLSEEENYLPGMERFEKVLNSEIEENKGHPTTIKNGTVMKSNAYEETELAISELATHYFKNGNSLEKLLSLQAIKNLDLKESRELKNAFAESFGLEDKEEFSNTWNRHEQHLSSYIENMKEKWKKNDIFFKGRVLDEDFEHLIADNFQNYYELVSLTDKVVSKEDPVNIKNEQDRILEFYNDRTFLKENFDYLERYLEAVKSEAQVFEEFESKDQRAKLYSLGSELHELDSGSTTEVIKSALDNKASYEQLAKIKHYLSSLKPTKDIEKLGDALKKDGGKTLELLLRVENLDEDTTRIVMRISEDEYKADNVLADIDFLEQNDLKVTSYLVDELQGSDDREKTVFEWKQLTNSFKQGNFDSENELHKNLEYTAFRELVNDQKFKTHIKNRFTFQDYLQIFEGESEEDIFDEKDQFEIDAVAYEAKLLKDYVTEVAEKANSEGREVYLIPNLSYGYLPSSAIIDDLEDVKPLIGVKVGSTESHNNKEVLNSRLFKGYRTEIMNNQPVMIVVDGTKHLVSRDTPGRPSEDTAARYPDAHQGYLNQVIAMNDALGFTEMDYSEFGKSEQDMDNLRETTEFQRLIGVYQHVLEDVEEKEPVDFHFWNTAGIDNLIIRNYHEYIKDVSPSEPGDIEGASLIFCNVGVLDEQLPYELKEKYPGKKHMPAYFDDSKKIINFDFGYDNKGVKYLNRLETAVKKSYNPDFNESFEMPEIVEYIGNYKPSVEEVVTG
mgnify:CR=1 FL=1